jgi:hypothetical protein
MDWVEGAKFDVDNVDADRETALTVYVQWVYLLAIGRSDAAEAVLQHGRDKFIFIGVVVGGLHGIGY